jgi:hypothetical protein
MEITPGRDRATVSIIRRCNRVFGLAIAQRDDCSGPKATPESARIFPAFGGKNPQNDLIL